MPPKKSVSTPESNEKEKEEVEGEGERHKRKFNMRNYTVRAHFDNTEEFEEWIGKETEKAPWYTVSSYTAAGTTKRIYACAFRKRSGYKKCERQLKVEFYENGKVVVMDSSDSEDHIHEIGYGPGNAGALHTVAFFPDVDSFTTWMDDQLKRFPWKQRTGQGTNIEIFQCYHRPKYGKLCRRILQVIREPSGVITIKEPHGLPPHEHPAATTASRSSARGNAEDDEEMVQTPSSSKTMSLRKRRRRITKDNDSEAVAPKQSEFEAALGEEQNVKSDGSGKPEASLESFVIVSDEFYEGGDFTGHNTSGGWNESKQKAPVKFENRNEENGLPASSQGSAKEAEGQFPDMNGDDDWRYDLKYFEKELAFMLSNTPLERLPEVRAKLRREMDLVYARQIVNEIASGFNSAEGRREVIDRINGVLHGL